MIIGALAAKFAAKRIEGGAEGENWGWKNYLAGAAGGFVAAFAASAIMRSRPDTSRRVLQGALVLIGYKFLINEVVSRNEKLQSWLGGADEDAGMPELQGYAGSFAQLPNGQQMVYGEDGLWRDADESHRLPGAVYGDAVQPIDPSMGFGDAVQPIDPSMGFGATLIDGFKAAYR